MKNSFTQNELDYFNRKNLHENFELLVLSSFNTAKNAYLTRVSLLNRRFTKEVHTIQEEVHIINTR